MTIQHGACPICSGSGRVTAGDMPHKHVMHGYDKETDTLMCRNCGGQYMYGRSTGKVRLRHDNGEPCVHNYTGGNPKGWRCYAEYSCKHCGDSYSIDSSD